MKVVISKCYGGFGISSDGLLWLSHRGVKYEDFAVNRYDSTFRANPVLVEMVETLGTVANTRFSKLCVIEIPDGVEFVIKEDGGYEYVAEKHRIWE